MTTAYTSLLGLALPVTGELSGTWGDTVNTAITSLLDTAVAGTTSITTDADITLTTTTGASNQARQAIILWNPASGTTTRYITAPAQSKLYTVINASGGTQSIVIRGAGPTTGVTIAKGESAMVAWNGSDFVKVSSSGGAITFTDLTVTGNTILGDAAADTLTVNATSTFASPVNFQGLVKLPSTGRSAAAALTVTAPAFLYGVASTYTDTTSSGTIAAMAPFYSIAQPTLSTSNVTTYTNAATLYIANAPAAGGSATITNPYALYSAAGANYFGGATTFNSTTQFNGVATYSANMLFSADNTYDIGASGATRPRNFYLGGNATIGGVVSTRSGGTYQIEMLYQGNAAQSSLISTSAGFNTNYNALTLQSNWTTSGAQGNAALSSWQLDLGNASASSIIDGMSVWYRAAGSSTSTRMMYVDYTGKLYTYGNAQITGNLLQVNTTSSSGAIANINTTSGGAANNVIGITQSDGIAYGGYIGTRNLVADQRQGMFILGTGSLTFAAQYNIDFLAGQTAIPGAADTGLAMRIYSTGAILTTNGLNAQGTSASAGNFSALTVSNAAGSTASVNQDFYTGANNVTARIRLDTTATHRGNLSFWVNNGSGLVSAGYFNGTDSKFNTTYDAIINGLTVGHGGNNEGTNTAFGYYALAANTSGSVNVAVGYNALKANTTASWNVAVGKDALMSVETGGSNVAVGRALATVVSGTDNTAVGMTALYYNTASYNTAVGSQALITNGGGANNTALGYGAGYANTSGNGSVFLGYRAGYNSTGGTNIYIGYDAGNSSGAGAYNTVVGLQAGYNATGSRNTFIGFDAGFNTTGSRNTFVGGANAGNEGSGYYVSSGSLNTYLGNFTGYQGSYDYRTQNAMIVLSDGDGNAPVVHAPSGYNGGGPFRVWTDRGNTYPLAGHKQFLYGVSAFSNPTVDLLTFETTGTTYNQMLGKVRVYQTGWSANAADVHVGYFTVDYAGNSVFTTMQIENGASMNTSNVGTLSGTFSSNTWTIKYTGNRATNYDQYAIEVTFSVHATTGWSVAFANT